jgi:FAD/FMN-containing dehydrogenase
MTISTEREISGRERPKWRNWVGNQECAPERIAHPRSEAQVVELLRAARAAGHSVSVAGEGHSFTPIAITDGLLIAQDGMRGVLRCDAENQTATVLGGTLLSQLGPALWEHGLALRNQGDIDAQSIAGAVATATHGSGVGEPSMSARLCDARLVTPSGEVVEVASDADLLRAARVHVGTLGVMTELTLDVAQAYELDEQIVLMSVDEVIDRWDQERNRRHFSFFWLPRQESAALYGYAADGDAAGNCLVKLYDLAEPGATAADGHRIGRAYAIYPTPQPERNFNELEYMVPAVDGKQAFMDIRELMLTRFRDEIFPIEIRLIRADDAFLSPCYGRDSCSLSVSGRHGADYWPFLRAVDERLSALDGRPHWGKLHFLTRERVDRLYPEIDRFREVRRSLDPDDRLLNTSLRPLLS